MPARIDPPAVTGAGEHVDWSLHRVEMAMGMGALSSAVYEHSRLPVREREAARWMIALINRCAVCQDTRLRDSAQHSVDEGFYEAVAAWSTSDDLTDRERMAAEFAQRFALDHQSMDDEWWARVRTTFADHEIADLIICCGMFLGLGRAMAVVGVDPPDERILI
jgi:alkylhydroperoxidase family enzyme